MTKDEKKQFITSLCDSTRDSVIRAVDYMPEEWDGIELRQYITERMERGAGDYIRRKDNRKRFRAYRNDVGTRFGL